jgi:thioredoxin reductase (NADPH)
MAKPAIMTLDDDSSVLNSVERDLRAHYGQEYRIIPINNGKTALEYLKRLEQRNETVALFLVDQRMPEMSGVEFLMEAIQTFPQAKRVLLTAYADTQAAIDSINEVGLNYYLMKPWHPPEKKLYPILDELLEDWKAHVRLPYDGIRIAGTLWSLPSHETKDFLTRHQIPYQWLDIEADSNTRKLVEDASPDIKLPVIFFPDGTLLVAPDLRELADKVGLQTRAGLPFYDLVVIGSGPAGLAAAVYAGSEGLKCLVIEKAAPGGQAGSSPKIENYLGFPTGISGDDLTRRAVSQAKRFGVEILSAQEANQVQIRDGYRIVCLSDGTEISCHSVLVATGASFHVLKMPGADTLTGAGIYYGAAYTEAIYYKDKNIAVVGGANSAAQGALYLSRFACKVTVLVRGHQPTASKYLVDAIGYNKVQGNFVFTARISNRFWVPGSERGQIGLIARQDLTPRSRFSLVDDQGESPVATTYFEGRPTHGGNDNFSVSPLPGGAHHDWLRIRREGSTFIGESSPDLDLDGKPDGFGELGRMTWRNPPDAVLVGLAVSSFTSTCTIDVTRGTFDSVRLEPSGSIVPLAAPDPVGVEITWTDVPRSIAAAGLEYTIDIDDGTTFLRGTADGVPILGASSARVLTGITEHGPVAAFDLPNAHAIGAECPGTGIAEPSPGEVAIAGAGADIWANGDQFLFAYKEVAGDFSARVTIRDRQFAPGSRWGRHGIMARQDCSPRSRYSFIADAGEDPQDSTSFEGRQTQGGGDNFDIDPPTSAQHADTLRLDRCGNELIGYVREEVGGFGGDPGDWVEIGRHEWVLDPPAAVQLGLAVTSGMLCEVTTITFEDWEVLPRCDAPVGHLVCTVNGSGGLDASWVNPPGADPAVPISIEVNGVEITTVPGSSTSASLDKNRFLEGQISRIAVINSSTVPASCSHPPGVSPQGFIKKWLILGPFTRPGGPAPGEDIIALDYLIDGATTEANTMPAAGQSITPDYGNVAASTGLASTPGRPDLNPGRVPTWFEHEDRDDTIDFNLDVFKTDINSVMCYAAAYVTVAEETTVDLGLASDDSVQVLIDGAQVHIDNVSRVFDTANTVQDTVPVLLTPGCHLVLVKVFDGLGSHGFRLRFQDATGSPVVPGRIGLACMAGGGFRRGDSDTNGAVNITDAVRILNVLFLGIGSITCDDAADSDDNGSVNITDAVRILNVLFLGIGVIPSPGSDTCGADPSDDALNPCVYGGDC